jgi:hypothetical protein
VDDPIQTSDRSAGQDRQHHTEPAKIVSIAVVSHQHADQHRSNRQNSLDRKIDTAQHDDKGHTEGKDQWNRG